MQSQQQPVTVDQPARPTQSRVSAYRGRPRFQKERTRGKIYHMTQENLGATSDIITGILQLGLIQVYVLFNPGASHSFEACRIVNYLHVLPNRLSVGVIISTPFRENININNIYRWLTLYIGGVKLRVDLMPLELHYFDVILVID